MFIGFKDVIKTCLSVCLLFENIAAISIPAALTSSNKTIDERCNATRIIKTIRR